MRPLTVEDRYPLMVAAGELFAGDAPPPDSPPLPPALASLVAAAGRFSALAGGDGAEVDQALGELIEAARAVGR